MITSLKKQLLPHQVLTEYAELLNYAKDYSNNPVTLPLAVVLVESKADITTVMHWANKNNVPVTVRGAGTGKSGGGIPLQNGIVLSVEKLNKILEVDRENDMVIVEPGVILSNLKTCLSKYGLFVPLDPSSADRCTVGGMVAENAGGSMAIKYGVTQNYVLGLSGVLGNGQKFQFGGKLVKDVAGYNVKQLLVGSEGTLAVISTIYLKCIPKPPEICSLWIPFNNFNDAMNCIDYAKKYNPCSAEFMQNDCIKAVQNYFDLGKDLPDANTHVLLRFDGHCRDYLESVVQQIKQMFSNAVVADTAEKEALFWDVRYHISEALSGISRSKVSEDITVPPSEIKTFLGFLDQLNQREVYSCIGYGHLGDGNIHVNILNINQEPEQWRKDYPQIISEVMKVCIEVGGTPSGEHGIGLSKKQFMKDFFSEPELELMKSIKTVFDPNHILNPDKIF